MDGDIAACVTVRGRVQGVGFRYATREAAKALGVVGWVRNSSDGSVEVLAQGPAADLRELVEFLNTGPRHARVASVDVTSVEIDSRLRGFDVTYSR